ncbi:hypothetical protein SAMN05216410_2578 [Sanguibacter gelidistatuariae]|uniref:Uncharacterized protein n=1 Tax=Sanguibacter gelidistatuariae TaxID=1814289 RepID=A0A1G6QNF0_9MICO|nr:hypothetical protein [Sanguibacter gelidistatuariae]SDC93215.1 hypothetical protein SAMN05216410_2578 [Sanguibacter gelidistatuariae]
MASNDRDPAAPPPAPAPGRAQTWLARWKPLSVWITSCALALEALVLVVLVVVGLIDLLGGSDRVVSVALALVVSAALGAWLLLACAVGLGAGRPWVRGPTVTVQVLAVLVGISFIQGGAAVLGGVLVVVGGATLVGLLSPPVSHYTGRTTFSFHQD